MKNFTIENMILTGKYNDIIDKKYEKLNLKNMFDMLESIAEKTNNLSVLTFLQYLLKLGVKNNISIEKYISILMSSTMCHIEGAYSVGLFYARKMLEKMENTDNLAFMLLYHNIPENLLSDKEAFMVAEKILTLNPNSEIALEIFEKLRNKERNGYKFEDIEFTNLDNQLLTEYIKEAIFVGKYDIAKKIFDNIKITNENSLELEFDKIIYNLSTKTENLCIFTFAQYMAENSTTNSEKNFWIDEIIILMTNYLHKIAVEFGGYSVALYYATERLKQNISEKNLEFMLFFNEISPKLVSDDEAVKFAKEILSINQNNKKAINLLKNSKLSIVCLASLPTAMAIEVLEMINLINAKI